MELTEKVTHLVLQLCVILVVAKVFGEFFQRCLKQPVVLGELVGGILIGPYAWGAIIKVPHMGQLFPLPGSLHAPIPLSAELWSIAQIGIVILLFHAGLETDKKRFLRLALPAFVVGSGGVLVPFFLGAGAYAIWSGGSMLDPRALFMGAIMTATSIGVTARVLSDLGKIDTREGTLVLAAAVLDDVIGILVLAIVVGIVAEGAVSAREVGITAAKVFGIWVGLTASAMVLSRLISKGVSSFRSEGAAIALAIALCLFAAALCEFFGLAMIIGAYMMGLALSGTQLEHYIQDKIKTICYFITPVFFVSMGMLVDFQAMGGLLWLGVIITILAILSKLFGCGLPSLLFGLGPLGATRVGIGMIPRAEVALIIAGIGLSRGVIDVAVFGVAIMMTFVTTFMAPVLLVPLFKR